MVEQKKNCWIHMIMLYINQKSWLKMYKPSHNDASKQDSLYTQDANTCSCAQPNGENTKYVIR